MEFNTEIKKRLSPILKRNNFFKIEESKGFVQFRNNNLYLIFTYDWQRSFEVDMIISFEKEGNQYSYFELRYIAQKYNDKNIIANQITEGKNLQSWIDDLFYFLEEYLPFIIYNEEKIKRTLLKNREKNIMEYEAKKELNTLKTKVDKLWKERDYEKIIKIVENYNGEVSKVTKKKYEYAVKKVS